MEILNRREQIGAKKLPPVIGEDVEKAGKSKYGVVKIGDGINVNNGVISVSAGGGTNIYVIPTPEEEQETREMTSEELTSLITAINEFIAGTKPLVFKYTDANGVLWAISDFNISDYDVTVPAEPDGNVNIWFYDGNDFNTLSISISNGLFIYSE